MSRLPRSNIQTFYFHIMIQGIDKNYIFEYPEDIKYYIKLMYKLKEEHEILIIAYCIMNNHAHLLVKAKKTNELSKYMQRLNTRYGKYYNYKFDRVGYVFRDRYKSEGIYSNEHLYHCIKYIYDNPVKAGICENPAEYPYSNYKKIDYIFNEANYKFIDIDNDTNDVSEEIINNYLTQNGITLAQLTTDKKKLTNLVSILKEKYNISLRQIAQKTNLNRELIRRIYVNK